MTTSNSKSKEVTAYDVLWYYPNIVGYLRIILMLASFCLASFNWKISIASYFLAFVGDVVDGYVARYFNQCSRFGSVLDMVTDRVSTCGLIMLNAQYYPKYSLLFILLVILDIGSHWFHVMSVTGHHKAKDSLVGRNKLLEAYYANFPLFASCCVGAELTFVLRFILFHYQHPILEIFCLYICTPLCALKQLVNLAQLSSAMIAIADADARTKKE